MTVTSGNQSAIRRPTDGSSGSTIQLRHGYCVATPAGQDSSASNVFIAPDTSLVAMVDGLGPHGSRHLATALVMNSIRTLSHRRRRLRTAEQAARLITLALASASSGLVKQSRQSHCEGGRGASVVIALHINGEFIIKSVGDCRCYLLRDKWLQTVTRDDTLSELLVSTAGSTPRTLPGLAPNRGVLRHLGQHDYVPNDEFQSIELTAGDQILFCTRGITSVISDSELYQTMTRAASPQVAAESVARRAQDLDPVSSISAAVLSTTAAA